MIHKERTKNHFTVREIETAICREVVFGIVDYGGHSVEVIDEDGLTSLHRSIDGAKIMSALMATGEDTLHVYSGDRLVGWVKLVYGNDGHDVIHDYTISLENEMRGAECIADLIAEGYGADLFNGLFGEEWQHAA